MKIRSSAWAAIALFLALPCAAMAQKGLYMGTGLGASLPLMSGDLVDDMKPAPGFALEFIHLGYNVTDHWGLSFQFGQASGKGDDAGYGHDAYWGEDYVTLSGRYDFDLDFPLDPYLELGAGRYQYHYEGEYAQFECDPAPGFRFAAGGTWRLGHFYLAPELSYHYARFDKGVFNPDYGPSKTRDFNADGSMVLFLVKAGYSFSE